MTEALRRMMTLTPPPLSSYHARDLLPWLRAISRDGRAPALYIDIGQTDGNRQSANWLDQVYTSFGFDHTYLVQPGGHTETYWSDHVPDYLRFYAGAWLPGPAPSATPNASPTPVQN